MKLTLSLILLWAMVLPGTAQSQTARFVPEACPERLLSSETPGISCGLLYVPQDRSSAHSPEIAIFIAQLPAHDQKGSPPIIYLAGGPGDSASADIDWWLNSKLRADHDIILIDQRGAGYSRPSLNCPEIDASDSADRLTHCRDRLQSAGINLATFNAESIALDTADLIAALQLDQVNLYGRSYGARLALLLAQKLPGRVRAMVLDSPYTGGESALAGAAANAWRSLQLLFAACRADSACHAAYPQLAAQFSQAAAALTAKPTEIDGISPGAALQLDGATFAFLLRDMLADANRLPFVPALIAAIAENDYDYLASEESGLQVPPASNPDTHSEGLYFSAFCADEAGRTSAAQIEAGRETLPTAFWPLVQLSRDLLAACRSWTDGGESFSFAPPPDDMPTLYLTGAYDPIAPAIGARSASPLAWQLVFPHIGHGVLAYEPCAEAALAAFLAEPTQQSQEGCLKGLRPPEFFIRQTE